MTRIVLVAITLLAQRLLGLPGLPSWVTEPLLPMVFLVGAAVSSKPWRGALPGLWLGLAWDLVLEPVVGPGGIAWCAAALAVRTGGAVLADRSTRAWAGLGALGALVCVAVRALAELPLGLPRTFGASHLALTVLLTAGWCTLVGWLAALDLPTRWRRHRSRRLR